ncbi:MAG: hypothetical protein ACI8XO_004837 [Verrucomicrobiales bacterium]
MRLDPNKGETIRGYEDLEETVRRGAQEYYGDAFGKNSFSGNEANRMFLNLGGKQFADITGISGLGHRGDGRTFVAWDYDRDGWTDIASINTNAPKLLLHHNEIGKLPSAEKRNHITIEFQGGNRDAQPSAELSNRDGYGARVTVDLGGRILVREHQCGQGVFAQNSARLLIGIGDATSAVRVTVRWPSGKLQTARDVAAGTALVFSELEAAE